jgi:CO dehydrogenase/acetyl-CoA synthase beta subunit
MVNIDTKMLPFKNFLSDRLSKKSLKANIDQSSIATTDDSNVGLDLQDDPSNKEHANSHQFGDKREEKKEEVTIEETKTDNPEAAKIKNIKLLNAL